LAVEKGLLLGFLHAEVFAGLVLEQNPDGVDADDGADWERDQAKNRNHQRQNAPPIFTRQDSHTGDQPRQAQGNQQHSRQTAHDGQDECSFSFLHCQADPDQQYEYESGCQYEYAVP